MNPIAKFTFIFLSCFHLISANECCSPCTDLSGFVIGVQGGLSHLLTVDLRNRTTGDGLRGYERISETWGAFAGYNWSFCHCFFLGAQAAYFDNGYGKVTYNSGNQYKLRSREWDAFALAGYVSDYGYNVYAKAGPGFLRQTYRRHFIRQGEGDPNSRKNGVFPVLALGVGHLLPCKINLFIEGKTSFAHDTSKITDGFKDIDPGVGFTDVINKVSRVYSFYLGLSKGF